MAAKAPAKSPRKASSQRKAAPRKAASRSRAAGATSGDAAPVNGAVVAPAPDNASPANGEVRESALPQDNSGMIKSPYPAAIPTYTFFPDLTPAQVANGQRELQLTEDQMLQPIIVPKYSTLKPKTLWLRRMWRMGPLAQAFEWLTLAGVPDDIQDRVFWMDDDAPLEYRRFWDGWFGEAQVTQGESPR